MTTQGWVAVSYRNRQRPALARTTLSYRQTPKPQALEWRHRESCNCLWQSDCSFARLPLVIEAVSDNTCMLALKPSSVFAFLCDEPRVLTRTVF
jgi:hypothetical protein